MLLFHGTRKYFKRFDDSHYGTGEGGVSVGFYFTDSLKGAYQHSFMAPGLGEPVVYVCNISDSAIVLDMQRPISMQNPDAQAQWEILPVAYSWAKDTRDWYSNLFKMLPFQSLGPDKADAIKYWFLKRHGFQVLLDTEGGYTDPYLCGNSIVVLDESIIEIAEILPSEQLRPEMRGHAKRYDFAKSQQKLGEAEVVSYLRRRSQNSSGCS